MKLTVELVPATSWGHNVRSEVSSSQWKKIREKCVEDAGEQCEICGANSQRKSSGSVFPKRRMRLDCHEIWKYDDLSHTQTLMGFIALCPPCHRVKHLGHTISIGLGDRAFSHLKKVNGLSPNEVLEYVEHVFAQWETRSAHPWTVDISFLEGYVP